MGSTDKRGRRAAGAAAASVAAMAMILSACSSASNQTASTQKRSKEYFPESQMGVKASPRVAYSTSGLPRGGGRHQIGKPYQIQGRWFHPKEDPNYAAEGKASWYGEAFHGRLTANGEVYDMTHLTAAHPTMPLPSYARVTNKQDGTSLIVRVNDRGPFARNRVIDLSKRAAEMLDYKHAGVATVRVEYLGPAPLHGQDDSFLMASYRPGGRAPDPSDGLPSGVMIAMSGPTPSQPMQTAAAPAFTGQPIQAAASQPAQDFAGENVVLPAIGPFVPDRPDSMPGQPEMRELALLSYADQRVQGAAQAFDAIIGTGLDSQALSAWWGEKDGEGAAVPYISLGTWPSREAADDVARRLSGHGRIDLAEAEEQGQRLFVLSLQPEGDPDQALRAAWMAGAADAFAVRD